MSRRASSTCVSRIIHAPARVIYAAFMDADVLLRWLPPGEMTGRVHGFDPRPGGGYEMSLFYPPDETAFRGKTAEREDRVKVRFVALEPPRRIAQAINFVSEDPGFQGEMAMTWTFEPVVGGTRVTVIAEDLPPGLRAEDNEAGSRLSLDQLARVVE